MQLHEYGAEQKETILLLHGGGLSWWNYRQAAEKNHATAQNNLGACYYNGVGVARDYAEALKWYRKAAEQGQAMGIYNLGLCYYNGHGVEKNREEAERLLNEAAAKGSEDARSFLKKHTVLGKFR